MKTLLIGNFGSGNIGDELILSQALENYPEAVVMTVSSEFPQKFCGKELDTIPFPPTGLRSGLQYLFSSEYRKILRSTQNDKEIKQVVFAGGGLFAIKFRACFLWFLVFLWVRKMYTPETYTFEHQGVDENLGYFSRLITKFVLSRATVVTVRDESSVRAVKSICGKNVENKGDRVNGEWRMKNEEFKKEKIVLINARAKFDMKKLDSHLRGNDRMVFMAFDKSDLKCVPKDFSGEIIYPQTKKEVFELFQRAECVVGERFHFLLLGMYFCGSQNTFILRKPYAEKVKNFCAENNIQSSLSSSQ